MSNKPLTSDDLAKMSDEEFMNLDPSVLETAPDPEDPSPEPDEDSGENAAEDADAESEKDGEDAASSQETPDADRATADPESSQESGQESGQANQQEEPEGADAESEAAEKAEEASPPKARKPRPRHRNRKPEGQGDSGQAPESKKPDAAEPAQEQIDYQAAYADLMKPFKASNKTVAPESPEELRALAQKGVRFTEKMMAIAGQLKRVKMLDAAGISENDLNLLIDIKNGDANAIRSHLQSLNIDPMDIDNQDQTRYQPNNHSVSDQDVAFGLALDEAIATEDGATFVVDIDKSWDPESKEHLRNNPDVLNTLLDQKRSGVFDKVVEQIDRDRLFGKAIPRGFLAAYEQVGNRMTQEGAFTPEPASEPQRQDPPAPAERVLEERPARRPTSGTEDHRKAMAASAPSGSGGAAPTASKRNVLEMSVEEFLQMDSKLRG